jgi:hypothetical protein
MRAANVLFCIVVVSALAIAGAVIVLAPKEAGPAVGSFIAIAGPAIIAASRQMGAPLEKRVKNKRKTKKSPRREVRP